MIDRCRQSFRYLLTKLNALGSLLLAYAMLNPSAMSELVALLPPSLKIPAALALPALWFVIVQWAKVRAVKPPAPLPPRDIS